MGQPAEEEAEITGQSVFCRACHRDIAPSAGYAFTTDDEPDVLPPAVSGCGDGGIGAREEGGILADEQRHRAVTRYLQEVNRFSGEIIGWVSAAIRAEFPDAAWLETLGFDNDDGELNVQALRIYDAADTLLADAEDTAGDADRAFAELVGKLSLDLDWLGQINGGDYYGTQRIDLT